MNEPPQKNTNIEAAIITWVAVGTIIFLTLSSIGLLSIALVIGAVQSCGRPKLAIVALLFGCAAILAALVLGQYSRYSPMLWSAYVDASSAGDWMRVLHIWLYKAADPTAWVCMGPIGLTLGATIELLREDQRGSDLARLAGVAPLTDCPAPLAHMLRASVDRKPVSLGTDLVVGTEWRTGARVTISESDWNKHVALFGTTGAGKTRGIR